MPTAAVGEARWRPAADGFDVAELPALVDGTEVDRILLSRIDPARYRFRARADRPGIPRDRGWLDATGAVAAVNGSYFARDGRPDTPVLSGGAPLGPREYPARHGAFVAGTAGAQLRDLATTSWQAAFTGAQDAMVSYPMLIGADGASRAGHTDAVQLANRTFVAQDRSGRIILGTTTDAFFSLARLADFLRSAPLDLSLALNLDGGPVACQAVRLGQVDRDFCGRWETADHGGQVEVLGHVFGSDRREGLPVALVVTPL